VFVEASVIKDLAPTPASAAEGRFAIIVALVLITVPTDTLFSTPIPPATYNAFPVSVDKDPELLVIDNTFVVVLKE
jgi:hypothetical protein